MPDYAEHVQPLADTPATMGNLNEPMPLDLLQPTGSLPATLEQFVAYLGLEVSPWQLQVLKIIDNDIRRKKVARGIPH